MGSLATFKSTYLSASAPVLPIGWRGQLAGLVAAVDRSVAEGNTQVNAVAYVTPKQRRNTLFEAQQYSNPYQAALVSDFLGIDAA